MGAAQDRDQLLGHPRALPQEHAVIALKAWDATSQGLISALAHTMAILAITPGNAASTKDNGVDPSAPRFPWLPEGEADGKHLVLLESRRRIRLCKGQDWSSDGSAISLAL